MVKSLRITATKYHAILLEIGTLLGISSGFLLVLMHIQATSWKDFLFTNADMLTLPLLFESLLSGEPLHWVFSSQIFIFPEFLLYVLSAVMSTNFQTALLINAFFNIVLLYLCVRFILYNLKVRSAAARLYAFVYILIIFAYLLLEQRTTPLAMYFLVTTAYYGVIIAGLFVIGLSVLLMRVLQQRDVKAALYSAAAIGIVIFLTSTANPMFLLQISAPLAVVSLLLLLFRVINWRTLLWLIMPHICAAVISFILRKTLFTSLLSPLGEINNYIHLENIAATVTQYRTIALDMATSSWQSLLTLSAITTFMLCAVVILVIALFGRRLRKKVKLELSSEQHLVVAFTSLAALAALAGTVITGNALTRYLLPLVLFPPLALIPLAGLMKQRKRSNQQISLTLGVLICLVLGTALMLQTWQAPRALATYYSRDAACLDNSLKDTPFENGVAQFWRARGLQLNSQDNHRVLQVTGDLKPFKWLYNNAVFKEYEVDFVIVDTFAVVDSNDHEVSRADNFKIDAAFTKKTLGSPSNIYHCDSFDIYVYSKNNLGRHTLNQRLEKLY